MEPDLLQEQVAFYRARAAEYGRSGAYHDQLEAVKRVLRAMGPFEQVVELACGTGIWTQELVNIGREITAIDASWLSRRFPRGSDLTRQRDRAGNS